MLKSRRILEGTMKILRDLPVTPFAIACLLLAGTIARASTLSIHLLAPFQSGDGNVFEFNATVTNTSNSTVFLNADAFNVDFPLMVDDSPFFLTPISLGPSNSFTARLFNVDVPAGAHNGVYTGSFEILGSADPTDTSTVAGSAVFNVEATPEPSSLILALMGFAGIGGSLVRRRPAK
jgi:hypothetical protein